MDGARLALVSHSPRHITINRGVTNSTRGSAFVVYEDIYDAKNAVEHLSGFNVCGRYLVVLYYQPKKMQKKVVYTPPPVTLCHVSPQLLFVATPV